MTQFENLFRVLEIMVLAVKIFGRLSVRDTFCLRRFSGDLYHTVENILKRLQNSICTIYFNTVGLSRLF